MVENSGDSSLIHFMCRRGLQSGRLTFPLFFQDRKKLGSGLHNKDPALPYKPPRSRKCIDERKICEQQLSTEFNLELELYGLV